MSRATGGASTAQQLDTQERRAFVLELRRSGASYRQIADAAIGRFGLDRLPRGWDERYAYMDVHRELEKILATCQELAEEVRELELQRLDALLLAVWPQATKGNQGAIDRVLRIMQRRAQLLGLDAPVRQDVTSGGEKVTVVLRWDGGGGDDAAD